MTLYELQQQIEAAARKAKSNPNRLVKVSFKNYYIFNAAANILFSVNYNNERDGKGWDLRDEATGELVDVYSHKDDAVNVARNWAK